MKYTIILDNYAGCLQRNSKVKGDVNFIKTGISKLLN